MNQTDSESKSPSEKSPIRLRSIFFGTPEISKTVLKYLLDKNLNIITVVTRADSKVGNKNDQLVPSPVKSLALERKIPILEPKKINDDFVEKIEQLKPDIIIVCAYGKMLPKDLLSLPGFGCLNLHASLLPKYRGASPIQNAILNGETTTGISIMLMNEKMDEGPVLSRKEIPIEPDETAVTLTQKIGDAGGPALVQTIQLWINRNIDAVAQKSGSATYCQLIEREDGHIIWNNTANHIYNMYRAFQPWPGIFTFWKTPKQILRIKLVSIECDQDPIDSKLALGKVHEIEGKVMIQTRLGSIIPIIIQPEGGKPMSIKDFINGQRNFLGSILS